MTGKEIRKALKKIFKENGYDDMEFDLVGRYLVSFRPVDETLEEQMKDLDDSVDRLRMIDEYYAKPKYCVAYDKKKDELYLKKI